MNIRLLFFAGLRERFAVEETDLVLPEGTQVKEIFSFLPSHPAEREKLLQSTLFAVNQCYVPPETELQEGDELALIPPVSGG